jgi:hypothetical protein
MSNPGQEWTVRVSLLCGKFFLTDGPFSARKTIASWLTTMFGRPTLDTLARLGIASSSMRRFHIWPQVKVLCSGLTARL